MIERVRHFVASVGDARLELQLSGEDVAERVVFLLHRKSSHVGYLCVGRNGNLFDALGEDKKLEAVGNIHLGKRRIRCDPCRMEEPFI